MSEYIGSRISLISKSDIKYIGTLHEINSDSHTVALESVTSYGTEGRKGNPAEEIPGSDQVYEYIVFRGSDVKELTIVAPPGPKENQPPKVPDDPAILGSARPAPQQHNQNTHAPQQPPPYPQQNPQFGYPPPTRFQGPGGPHGFPGQPGAVPGYGMQYPPPGPPPGYPMGYPSQGFLPPQGHFQQGPPMPRGPSDQQQMYQQRPTPQIQGSPQRPGSGKQDAPQPSYNAQQSIPSQPAAQRPVEMSSSPGPAAERTNLPPVPPVDSKPSVSAATAASAPPQARQQPPRGPARANNRVAVPLPAQKRSISTTEAAPPSQPQTFADATQQATAAVAAAMAKLGATHQAQMKPQQDGVEGLTQKVDHMRFHDQQRGGTRGRGRGAALRGVGRREGAPKVEVPKEDFDFESSNAKFNKQDLVKEAIATGSPVGSPANGDIENPLENGHAEKEDDVVIPAAEKTYDKKSSFFDNISSDLKDRTEGGTHDGRAIRSQERTKNWETFGQTSVDGRGFRGRGRRGFRGRGGFRGRATATAQES